MSDYGEPLASGFDPVLAPAVAAALHATAEALNMFSAVFGRNPSEGYNMARFFEAHEESRLRMYSLTEEQSTKAVLLTARTAAVCVRDLFPRPDLDGAMSARGGSPSRELLVSVLKSVSPLIDNVGREELGASWSKKLIDGLSALDAGEVQPLFKPGTRKAKNVNAYTVASIKYEFFLMRKNLIFVGFSLLQIEELFGQYAKVRWNTASRWSRTVDKVLKLEEMLELKSKPPHYAILNAN